MTDSRGALLVFSKPPRPGLVKKRLIPALGEQAATELYRRLLRKTLETARESSMGLIELWSPDPGDSEIRTLARKYHMKLRQQEGEDLGARMAGALAAALSRSPFAMVIGSDCPALRPVDLTRAAGWLASGADAVLGPTCDGGYYLIGLRRPVLDLFMDMPWGTDRVLVETRARLRRAMLNWHELPEYPDIDRPEDLAHLPVEEDWILPPAN